MRRTHGRAGARRGEHRFRRRADSGASLPPDLAAVVELQRTAGNRAVSEALSAPIRVQRLVGLAKQSRVRRAARATVRWDAAKTPLERATDYAGPALAALEDANIPRPTIAADAPGGGYAAEFRPENWRIVVDVTKFAAEPAAERARTLIGNFYHEARHADQFYLAARYLALTVSKHTPLTPKETQVWERMPAFIHAEARLDPPPEAGALTPSWTRRKYEAAAARARGYIEDFTRQPRINQAKSAPARLLAEIQQVRASLPAQFASEAQRQSWLARAGRFRPRIETVTTLFDNSWYRYVESGVEREAYELGSRVGGSAAPSQAEISHMTEVEDGRLRLAILQLEGAIDAVPLAPVPVAPLAVQPHAVPDEIESAVDE